MCISHCVFRFTGAIVISITLAGCTTPKNDDRSRTQPWWNAVSPVNQVPFLLYFPSYAMEQSSRKGFVAEIALPERSYSTNRIEVTLQGQIRIQGAEQIPEGSTITQAINYAGGFTDFAYSKKLRLQSRTGNAVTLHRHSRLRTGIKCPLVWYDTNPRDFLASPKDAIPSLPHDYILQSGDVIHVDVSIF